jgi:hypothetical protein
MHKKLHRPQRDNNNKKKKKKVPKLKGPGAQQFVPKAKKKEGWTPHGGQRKISPEGEGRKYRAPYR